MTVLALTLLSVGLHFRINDSATGCSLKKELRATRKHTIASKFTPTSNQESVLPRMVTQLPSFKQCTVGNFTREQETGLNCTSKITMANSEVEFILPLIAVVRRDLASITKMSGKHVRINICMNYRTL